MAASRNFDQIGERILLAARGELYLNLPYLDAALCQRVEKMLKGGGVEAVGSAN